MTTIIPLARCRYGADKDKETDRETWEREMARFPDRVRSNAANLAAHSHDVTLVGERLLVSCSWYNSKTYPDCGWFDLDGTWTPISAEDYDRLYPEHAIRDTLEVRRDPLRRARASTIQTEFLA